MSEDRETAPRGAVRSGDGDGHAASGGGSDPVAHPARTGAVDGGVVDGGVVDGGVVDGGAVGGSAADHCGSGHRSSGPPCGSEHSDSEHSDSDDSDSDSDDTASSHEPPPQAPRTLGARAAVAAVRWYQVWISPNLLPSCRFMPSCSAYAVEALTVHGAIRGIGLTVWRLLRCAPWHPGGWDPVPPPRGPGRSGPEPGAADPAPTDPSRTEGL